MTLLEVFENLPKTERTMLRHRKNYAFELLNDFGQPCEYRVVYDGEEIGMVKYYGGRKLACYTKD